MPYNVTIAHKSRNHTGPVVVTKSTVRVQSLIAEGMSLCMLGLELEDLPDVMSDEITLKESSYDIHDDMYEIQSYDTNLEIESVKYSDRPKHSDPELQ